MKKLCAASIAALLVATGGTAFAQAEADKQQDMQMSQAECESLWNRADAAGSGSLLPSDADGFVSNFGAADVDGDGSLTATEFLAACRQGFVHDNTATGAGEGGAGTDTAPEPQGSPREY